MKTKVIDSKDIPFFVPGVGGIEAENLEDLESKLTNEIEEAGDGNS